MRAKMHHFSIFARRYAVNTLLNNLYELCGIATNDGIGGKIFGYYCSSGNDGILDLCFPLFTSLYPSVSVNSRFVQVPSARHRATRRSTGPLRSDATNKCEIRVCAYGN